MIHNPNKGKRGGWNKIEWPAEALEKLGKVSDVELAEEFGFLHRTVRAKRNELGIPPSSNRGVPKEEDPNEGNEKWRRLGGRA